LWVCRLVSCVVVCCRCGDGYLNRIFGVVVRSVPAEAAIEGKHRIKLGLDVSDHATDELTRRDGFVLVRIVAGPVGLAFRA
jgi:hypothetical protein